MQVAREQYSQQQPAIRLCTSPCELWRWWPSAFGGAHTLATCKELVQFLRPQNFSIRWINNVSFLQMGSRNKPHFQAFFCACDCVCARSCWFMLVKSLLLFITFKFDCNFNGKPFFLQWSLSFSAAGQPLCCGGRFRSSVLHKSSQTDRNLQRTAQ